MEGWVAVLVVPASPFPAVDGILLPPPPAAEEEEDGVLSTILCSLLVG